MPRLLLPCLVSMFLIGCPDDGNGDDDDGSPLDDDSAGDDDDATPGDDDDATADDDDATADDDDSAGDDDDSAATPAFPELTIACEDALDDVYVTPQGLPPWDETVLGDVVRCAPEEVLSAAEVEVVPDDPRGQIDLAGLERRLPGAALLALTHVPTNSGLVNPAAEAGALARRAGVPYLLDACQSAGQLPLDVRSLGCDVLSASARKFLRGPRGAGFLYVRQDRLVELEPVAADLRAADWVARDRLEWSPTARRFETWEASIAARLGMGAAVDYALRVGMDRIWARARALADDLRAGLAALPKIRLRDKGVVRGAIVPFTVDGRRPAEVRATLGQKE